MSRYLHCHSESQWHRRYVELSECDISEASEYYWDCRERTDLAVWIRRSGMYHRSIFGDDIVDRTRLVVHGYIN